MRIAGRRHGRLCPGVAYLIPSLSCAHISPLSPRSLLGSIRGAPVGRGEKLGDENRRETTWALVPRRGLPHTEPLLRAHFTPLPTLAPGIHKRSSRGARGEVRR